MVFTDKDRQALVELVNNLQHAYSSEADEDGLDATRIALPCRLLRSAAEAAEKVYRPDLLAALGESEIELLLAYLSRAVDAVTGSLGQVIAALPAEPSAGMRAKLAQRLDDLAAMRRERASIFETAVELLAREDDILAERKQLAALQERRQTLLRVREELQHVGIEDVRQSVARMEAELGTAGAELERLQRQTAENESALAALDNAVAAARERLGEQEKRAEDQLGRLLGVSDDLLAALAPHMARCERSIQEALGEIADKTAEGKQLRQELRARAEQVRALYEQTADLAGALKVYAESNDGVARGVPTVLNSTRERLARIGEELQEVDEALARALRQHQSATRVADAVSL